jgi:hypothetical protein
LAELDARYQLVQESLKNGQERLQEAVRRLDHTKEQLRSFDKKINDMNMENGRKMSEKFERLK